MNKKIVFLYCMATILYLVGAVFAADPSTPTEVIGTSVVVVATFLFGIIFGYDTRKSINKIQRSD